MGRRIGRFPLLYRRKFQSIRFSLILSSYIQIRHIQEFPLLISLYIFILIKVIVSLTGAYYIILVPDRSICVDLPDSSANGLLSKGVLQNVFSKIGCHVKKTYCDNKSGKSPFTPKERRREVLQDEG